MTGHNSTFSEREFLRYSRQLQLPGIGVTGQQSLRQATITIVGCGGLGAPASLYLAAAGIGKLRLIDADRIELSNLQRQICFSEAEVGQPKASSTEDRLKALNSDIQIEAIAEQLNVDNAKRLLAGSDLVLDCCDNAATRYLINDHCKQLEIPWIYASIYQFSGQCALFTSAGPCYRCLFPVPAEGARNCAEAGVIGALPGILGSMQAIEAIKYLCQLGTSQTDSNGKGNNDSTVGATLILLDTLDWQMRRIQIQQATNCPSCNPSRATATNIESNQGQEKKKEEQQKQQREQEQVKEIEARELLTLLESAAIRLVDIRSVEEHRAYNIGGINIPLTTLLEFSEQPQLLLEHLNTLADDHKNNQTYHTAEDVTLVFYCQSGQRSLKALQAVKRIPQLINSCSLKGGLAELIKHKQSLKISDH